MATFTVKQQQEILKRYATLLVKNWPADSRKLEVKEMYEAKKQLDDFLKVMTISPKASVGGCVNLARLINLKYNLKGDKLDEFIWDIDYKLFDQYELIDTLGKETA